eukprot:TRINITY_DN110732_c0_g1_i1.p1 TRINITY_DN110732_c0_g1~~TRINITY_DN110732_c0_g1_i1.p1  ORF type:complete len:632 (-),score=93.15 TRINITY_DN110732_c0_g1_i1:41-1936(-)
MRAHMPMPLALLALGILGSALPVCQGLRDVLDCNWDPEWTQFRKGLVANAADGFPLNEELYTLAEHLLQKHGEALAPQQDVAYGMSAGMMSLFGACNAQDHADAPRPFCLYGAICAFWLLARFGHPDREGLLRHAEFLLGVTMRFSLDFMESSGWPISSVDILANLQRPKEHFRLPGDLRQDYGDVLRPVPHESFWEDRQVPSGVRRVPVQITVWELGVHASLSAEPLTMWARFIPKAHFKHRNLIQDQYPPWLPNKCETLYWHEKLKCDTLEDDITALFRRRMPLSATSKDPVPDIDGFATEFKAVAGQRLAQVDAFLCTVAYLCLLVADLNLPVLGYFGHPLLFMVPRTDEERRRYWPRFVEMAKLDSVGFAVSDAFLQMQYDYQVGAPRLPAIRTHALYTGATYMPMRPDEILVMDRPHESMLMCLTRRLLPKLADEPADSLSSWPTADGRLREASRPGYPYRFITRQLTDRKFSTFAQFRAVVLWPYDMDLITFYEFYSMNMPIFMPSHLSKYIFQQDHMLYDGWWDGRKQDGREQMWDVNAMASPFNETSIDGARYTVMFTDYFRLPEVQYFASLPELLEKLPKTDFFEVTQTMARFNHDALVESANAWRSLLRRTTGWDAELLQL